MRCAHGLNRAARREKRRHQVPDDRFFHKRAGHSEKVNRLSDFEELAWRYYVESADDFGVMRFSALSLQHDHDRMARKPAKAVQRALDAVRDVDLIRTFDHQERTYCYQLDWQDWQKVTYPRATVHPPIPESLIGGCSALTQALFVLHPGGKGKWKVPRILPEHSGNLPEIILGNIQENSGLVGKAKANGQGHGYGQGNGARGTNPSDFAPEVRNRVADFIERYKALYVKHRKGAHYVGNPQKDFPEAALLCETWDDERLDKLAHSFLTTDHDFAENGSRTLAQFRSMASWCDGKLRERGL